MSALHMCKHGSIQVAGGCFIRRRSNNLWCNDLSGFGSTPEIRNPTARLKTWELDIGFHQLQLQRYSRFDPHSSSERKP